MTRYAAVLVLVLVAYALMWLAYWYGQREHRQRMGRMLDYYTRRYVKNREGIDAVRTLKELLKSKGFR